MATGIVVRSIAPYIKNKTDDPAVIAMDELGTYAISLLSGHLGGANELALELEKIIGTKAVITTASDIHGVLAVDMFAKQNKLIIDNMEDAKVLTAMLLNGKNILQLNETLKSIPTSYVSNLDEKADGQILITHKQQYVEAVPTVKLLAKNIVLGIGCRKNVAGKDIIEFITDSLNQLNIDKRCICNIGSVDIKAEEAGIIETAKHFNVNFNCIRKEEIEEIESLFSGSDFVKKTIGVSCVCEPVAAIIGGKKGKFLLNKTIRNGITLAIFEKEI